MRTTLTLDEDVAALVEAERRRTGETFREAVNRLLRKAAQRGDVAPPSLPLLPGKPVVDVADVSGVLGRLEDEVIRDKDLY